MSTLEDGRSGSPDPEILDRATELGRCLFSQDRDLLAEARKRNQLGIPFAGVVYIHQQKATIGECVLGLELIAFACEPADLANRVEYRAEAVANAPDLETEIDSAYGAIADLSHLPATLERETQVEQTFARLRELQRREAEQFRQQFEDNLMLPLDAGERILGRSRNLRKQLEDLAVPDSFALLSPEGGL